MFAAVDRTDGRQRIVPPKRLLRDSSQSPSRGLHGTGKPPEALKTAKMSAWPDCGRLRPACGGGGGQPSAQVPVEQRQDKGPSVEKTGEQARRVYNACY